MVKKSGGHKAATGLLQDIIPPLAEPDKTTAITSVENATHFASKMGVPVLDLLPPSVPLYATATLATVSTEVDEVKKILHLDTNKATDGDQISLRLLKGFSTTVCKERSGLVCGYQLV